MNLKEYLESKKITQKRFAELLGITYNHFGKIINGREKAGIKLAQKIEDLTRGVIKKESLINECDFIKCPTCGRGNHKKRDPIDEK